MEKLKVTVENGTAGLEDSSGLLLVVWGTVMEPLRTEREQEVIAAEVALRCNAHEWLVEALAKFGTITPCGNCDGSGRNQHGSCCRITGHARECKCLVCQWKTAYYRLEDKMNALRAAGVEC
jgi:hypothetical protein